MKSDGEWIRAARIALLLLCCAVLAAGSFLQPSFAEETMEEEPADAGTATVYLTLKKGSSGEPVLLLQQRLAELGYDPGGTDGIYGSTTEKAVRSFQRRNSLDADGIAGPLTQERLYAQDAVPAAEATDVLSGEWPMLVNRDHPVDEDFVPADLILLSDVCDRKLVKIKYSGIRGVREAVDALITMLEAAKKDRVTKWQVSAGYRSWTDQEATLNSKINHYLKKNTGWSRNRARSAALHTVAEPGTSEHHLGLAFDVNVPGASSFSGTKQCKWLHKHCWEYGFIVRYQKEKESITGFTAEAWHIRYVGTKHSMIMRDLDLCLEEYLEKAEAGEIEMEEIEDVNLDDAE